MDVRAWVASLPNFRTGAFWLFVAVAVVTLVFSDQPVAIHLLLTPAMVIHEFELWQPMSAGFIYPDGGLGMLVGTFLIQWFVGGELESFWNTRRYLALVLGCSLAGYAVMVALAFAFPIVGMTTVGGATPIDLAALTAFGVVYGNRSVQLLAKFPINARTFSILFIALIVLSPPLRGASWPTIVPGLVAIVGALLVTTQPWKRMQSQKTPQRSHLRVVPRDPSLLN